MLCRYIGEQQAPRSPLDGALVAASTFHVMAKKHSPFTFQNGLHANDNSIATSSPLDPRLKALIHIIARQSALNYLASSPDVANDNESTQEPYPGQSE